jgi:hypothetical protein
MPPPPLPPAKVVRFHWEEVSHLDGPRRVPVINVEVQDEDGPVSVAFEVLPGSLEVRGFTAIRSPMIGAIAKETAQAFVDGAEGEGAGAVRVTLLGARRLRRIFLDF